MDEHAWAEARKDAEQVIEDVAAGLADVGGVDEEHVAGGELGEEREWGVLQALAQQALAILRIGAKQFERQQLMGKEVAFRADAAFAKPEVYEALEERSVKYAIRIPANDILQRDIEELLKRPVGRPTKKPLVEHKGFLYQAAGWKTARRVVAKVEHHSGELFPRVGFIVTNLTLPNRAVVRFYNKRGTAEQWIKEGKQAVKMTRLSCHKFRSNEVRLWLTIIAYNLGNLWRRLVLPQRIEKWSLTSLQQRLVKTGGRLVKHARYYWLLLAEGHLTRRLFASMLGRIDGLALPSG